MRNFLFVALLAVVTVAFLWIIKTFAYPIFWAAIIAGMFYPIYKFFNKKLKVPNLSTAITMSTSESRGPCLSRQVEMA